MNVVALCEQCHKANSGLGTGISKQFEYDFRLVKVELSVLDFKHFM